MTENVHICNAVNLIIVSSLLHWLCVLITSNVEKLTAVKFGFAMNNKMTRTTMIMESNTDNPNEDTWYNLIIVLCSKEWKAIVIDSVSKGGNVIASIRLFVHLFPLYLLNQLTC